MVVVAVPEAGSLPPRPVDAGSLSGLLSWSSSVVWPEGPRQPAEPELMAPEAWRFGYWWGQSNVTQPSGQWPYPPDDDAMADYLQRVAVHLAWTLATADVLAAVVGGDDFPQGVSLPLQLHATTQALPESWRYLVTRTPGYDDYAPDSPDLWRWAVARRDSGARRQARNQGRTFPNALRTAQAVYDALAVVLPVAQPKPVLSAPTPRRKSSWR